jgi:hypothetical protein
MTFHSVSLLVIGGYFVAMIAVAQWLAYAGANWGAGGNSALSSRRRRRRCCCHRGGCAAGCG